MKKTLSFCVATAALLLAGCASAPIRYHTLMAPATTGRLDVTTAASAPFFIELLPVGIPPQLDQPGLVVRQDTSVVSVLDNERWAGPIADEIRAALSAQLTRRLGTQDIAGLPRQNGRPLLRIKLQVRRLDAWVGQQVQLDADWSLGFADEPARRLVCRSQLQAAAPGAYAELIAAEQQILESLAERMSETAQKLQNSKQAVCP